MKRLSFKILRFSLIIAAIVIGSIALYLITAYAFSSIEVDREAASQEVEIYILTNGVHTDIVVPTITKQFNWFKDIHHLSDSLRYKHLAIGWGDKGFYLNTPTWADLKFSTAFNTAFGLSSTAMHTTFYERMEESESCKRIMISKGQYDRLIQFINQSFQRDDNGKVMLIETDANYGETDAFYEAQGTYSFMNTCNSWANLALKKGGQRACLWTPFQQGIFDKYHDDHDS